MRKFIIWALSLLVFLSSAEAAVRQYTLELTNDLVSPDGFVRRAVTVNHNLPGSVITANKNDQLEITLVNNLNDTTMAQGTSIHWHGIFQHRLAAQDGTSWVTQCPIAASDSFLYNFTVAEQTGTYWYHSHVATQYCDGLSGPLIIYDPDDPLKRLYDVDDASTIIMLQDWFHMPSPEVAQTLGLPASHLVNGRGRESDSIDSDVALSVVNVDQFKRYRFRLINGACLAGYIFSIDGHDLTVIEIDGVETNPKTVGVVTLFAGQRVSVVVNANKPIGNYWIRAIPIIPGVPVSVETANSAIFRYSGADDSEPKTIQTNFDNLKEEDLVPFVPSTMSQGEPDIKINLIVDMVGGPSGNFTVNGVQYTPPSIPLLLQILSGKVDPRQYLPNGTVYTLPRNKLIEITIPGDSPLAPHPFHLHGHNFGVTRSAGTTKINTQNPPLRDVVNTGFAGDNVTFRFRTDNPGPWFLHCHVDLHLDSGLAIVFAEDPQDQTSGPDSEEVTQQWKDLCPKWNSLKTGKQYTIDDLQDYEY